MVPHGYIADDDSMWGAAYKNRQLKIVCKKQ